jgi:spermidine synthase
MRSARLSAQFTVASLLLLFSACSPPQSTTATQPTSAPSVLPPGVLYDAKSPFNRITVRQRPDGVRSLTFDDPDVVQTVLDPTKPHELVSNYTRAMTSALCVNATSPKSVLIIGLGGGALPSFLRHYFPDTRVTVVELDPDVIAVAKKFFAFKEDDRCRAVCGDGRKFIEDSKDQYDLIYLDAYGSEDIPRALATAEFLRAVKARVSPNGIIASNISGPSANPLYYRMIATYRLVFPELHRVDAGGRSVQRTIIALPAPLPAGAPPINRDALTTRARALQSKLRPSYDLPALIADGYQPVDRTSQTAPLLDADKE